MNKEEILDDAMRRAQERVDKWDKFILDGDPNVSMSVGTRRESVIDGMAWALFAGVCTARSSALLGESLPIDTAQKVQSACLRRGAMAALGSIKITPIDDSPDAHHG